MSEGLFILTKPDSLTIPTVREIRNEHQLAGLRIVGLDFTQKDHPFFPKALLRLKAQQGLTVKFGEGEEEKPFHNPDRTQDQIDQINRQIAVENGWERKFSDARQEWRWHSPNNGGSYLAPPDYYNNDPRYCEQRLAKMVALGFRFDPPTPKIDQPESPWLGGGISRPVDHSDEEADSPTVYNPP